MDFLISLYYDGYLVKFIILYISTLIIVGGLHVEEFAAHQEALNKQIYIEEQANK